MPTLKKFWEFLKLHYKGISFAFLGLFVGLILFLPLDRIQLTLFQNIEKQSGVRLQAQTLKLNTGYWDGWTYGGLLALQLDQATFQVKNFEWKCETLRLSPHLWKLIMFKMDLGMTCQMNSTSSLKLLIKDLPLGAPTQLNVKAEVTEFNLETLTTAFPSLEMEGNLNGTVELFGMNLRGFRDLPQTLWNLEAQNFTAPPVNHPFLKIPAIGFGSLKTRGTMKGRKIDVAELAAGNAQSPLELAVSMFFELGPNWVPSKGEINGSLRTQKEFEEGIKNTLDLDSVFGKIKPSGKREFKKAFEGSPIMLLQPPTS